MFTLIRKGNKALGGYLTDEYCCNENDTKETTDIANGDICYEMAADGLSTTPYIFDATLKQWCKFLKKEE